MRFAALLTALALSGCFVGSEFHEATDDEIREALSACGLSGARINPPGDQTRIDFGRVPARDRAKHDCFQRYLTERDWIVTTTGSYE